MPSSLSLIMRAGLRTGRHETGLPARSDALEPGFHGVLRARRARTGMLKFPVWPVSDFAGARGARSQPLADLEYPISRQRGALPGRKRPNGIVLPRPELTNNPLSRGQGGQKTPPRG